MRFFLPNKKERNIFYPIMTFYNIIYNMIFYRKGNKYLYENHSSLSYKFKRVGRVIDKIVKFTKRKEKKNALFLYNKFLVEVLGDALWEIYNNNAIVIFDNVIIKRERINVNADYFEGRSYMKALKNLTLKNFFDNNKYRNKYLKVQRIRAVSKDNKINTNIFLHKKNGKGK